MNKYRIIFLCLLLSSLHAFAVQLDSNRDTGFVFRDDGEEVEELVTSHFECYQKEDTVEQTICLDDNLSIFHDLVEGAYQQRVGLVPATESHLVRKQHKQWLQARGRKCLESPECYLKLYKKQLVDLLDSPELVAITHSLNEVDVLTIGLYGRKVGNGYFVNRIETQLAGDEKTRSTIYVHQFLDEKSWEVYMPTLNLQHVDANFDGFEDIVLFLGESGRYGAITYLLYNPVKANFTSDRLLNSLRISSFDDKHKMVTVNWSQPENKRFGIDYYRYDDRNRKRKKRLTLAFRHTYLETKRKDGTEELRRIIYKTRSRKKIKIATDTISRDQIGELPEVMFRQNLLREPNNQRKRN